MKAYFEEVEQVLKADAKGTRRIVAIGECGLDYSSSNFSNSDRDIQNIIFMKQINLASKYDLPLYFHSKGTKGAFAKCVHDNRSRIKAGVVTFFEGDS